MLSTAAIAWLPWRAESFARARAEGRPVLLSLAPTWCGHSAEMDSATFADTEVAALVTAHFVAIRVDPDRRPDIAERYSLGGWPTTAFLTPDGEVMAGMTYIPPDQMRDVLGQWHAPADYLLTRSLPFQRVDRQAKHFPEHVRYVGVFRAGSR